MKIKRFNTFKINESKIAETLQQAIEDHMNGDMESIETISHLTNLDSEIIVNILNKYTISDYDGAFDDIMRLV
jgi:molybdopterin-biosynthesis enzyme MoeA-like protein